ncbi:hypothetical protein [Pseudomonas koreensis]|uniref:hypothetical protein n=1 Tax=Pseudomonas koreensis TaxID=198620 RepID=UPI000987A7DD|nr:hypothetical protein [Pseudomonas koreensis]
MDITDDDIEKEPLDDSPRKFEMSSAIEGTTDQEQVLPGERFETHVLHAQEGQYWAELRVSYAYSASGSSFTCKVLEYRALNNYRYNGNVLFYLSLVSGQGNVIELTDQAHQTEIWNELHYEESISANRRDVTVGFDFIYDRQDASDPTLKTYKIVSYRPPPPSMNIMGNFFSSTFNVTGDALGGATLVLDSGAGTIGSGPVDLSGRWSVPVTVADTVMHLNIQAYQIFTGKYSDRTGYSTVYRAKFTWPMANSVMNTKDLIVFKGVAAPGTAVTVVDYSDNSDVWSETLIVPDAAIAWELPSLKKLLRSGNYAVVAKLNYPRAADLYSPPVSFGFLGLPETLNPDPSNAWNQSFPVEGSNGLVGARIEIYLDLTNTLVGSGSVSSANGSWSAAVAELPAGPVSLVAEQIFQNVRSGIGQARGFKIRPPQLRNIATNIGLDGLITFNGDGYTGATVEIVRVSGPDAPPISPVPVVNGKWGATAADWPFGEYGFRHQQKVPDGANGWIESLPSSTSYFTKYMRDITDPSYTKVYRPVFSGKGYNGATVSFYHPGGDLKAAPDAVVSGGTWSSTANEDWGPVKDREVHIQQCLEEHCSLNRVVLKVSIAPLPPTVDEPPLEGLRPMIRGNCLEGATVSITFRGDNNVYSGNVEKDTWTFQRTQPFPADVPQTIFVTQTAADQTSEAQSREFTLYPAMFTPVIMYPVESGDVVPDAMIRGIKGVSGATMKLHESQFQEEIAEALLVEDGDWAIQLTGLKFGAFTIFAKQERDGRPSERSDHRTFNVVVPPPQISTPQEGDKMTRTATLRGVGFPSAQVEIWFKGAEAPWLSDITVPVSGDWQQEVELPVGNYIIRARQLFTENNKTHESAFTEDLTYDVVPAAPFVETPVEDERVGRQMVVSGFGVPGDTVTVMQGGATASAVVLEDRTWSINVEAHTEGDMDLKVTSMLEGFESDAAVRKVVAGLYLPIIAEPAAGRRVHDPVAFSGVGEEGVGRVVSWFDPEQKWTPPLTVAANQWRGKSDVSLPPGGTWCRFRQTLTSQAGVSDWAESARFEVEPVPRDADSRKADERS